MKIQKRNFAGKWVAALGAVVAMACFQGLGQDAGPAPVVAPEEYALPVDAVDTAQVGFKVRVVQASNQNGTLANSLARTEAQLAGFLINPATGEPYENIADLDP